MRYQALLFGSDEKTAHVVEKILSELDFAVVHCSEPFAAVKKITSKPFDALVIDCDSEQDAALLFKSARNSASPSPLAVALVAGHAGIAKAFRIGANLVLSKPINVEQSKATLRVARGMLRKADSAKPASSEPSLEAPASTTTDLTPLPQFTPSPDLSSQPFALSPSNTVLPTAPAAAAGLENEAVEEPAPALGVTEAALLESMPGLLPAPLTISSGASEERPSQPLPASPLNSISGQPTADVASKISIGDAQTLSKPAGVKEDYKTHGTARSLSVDTGARGTSGAAAAAPAKEISRAVVKSAPVSSQAEAAPKRTRDQKLPAKSANLAGRVTSQPLDLQNQPWGAAAGSSKKNFLIAAVLVISLAAAGYFAWPYLQPSLMSLGIVGKNLAPEPVSTAAPMPAPASSSSAPVPAPDSSTAGSPTDSQRQQAPPVESVRASTQPSEPSASGATTSNSSGQVAASATLPQTSTPHPSAVDRSVAPAAVGKHVLQNARVSQGISKGLLIKQIKPVYPELAKQMRVEGDVQLEATVSKDGSTTKIKVLKGDPRLSRAAVDAVRQWKYTPYLLNGQPAEFQTQITINFTAQGVTLISAD